MKPAARSFGFGKALLLAGLIVAAVACVSDPEGTTPDCVQDVSDGKHEVIENGCNGFAVCVSGDKIVNPSECCKQFTNKYENDVCLAGFGAGPFPNAGAGGGN